MDTLDKVLITLVIADTILLACVVSALVVIIQHGTNALNTIITNQMFLSRNVNTRIGTARMPTGMPDPAKPPQVAETQLIGRGQRSRRRVVGGEETSEQYLSLKRGLPREEDDE